MDFPIKSKDVNIRRNPIFSSSPLQNCRLNRYSERKGSELLQHCVYTKYFYTVHSILNGDTTLNLWNFKLCLCNTAQTRFDYFKGVLSYRQDKLMCRIGSPIWTWTFKIVQIYQNGLKLKPYLVIAWWSKCVLHCNHHTILHHLGFIRQRYFYYYIHFWKYI